MSTDPIISLHKVMKEYGTSLRQRVLHDVNLDLYTGEFLAVVGQSGSGKSTLLNIMGLLDTPSSGEVIIEGASTDKLSQQSRAELRRNTIGFIFQSHHLLAGFNALENALLPCRMNGLRHEAQEKDRVVALLERVGLGDRLTYRPDQLSGGQRQRVAIVRALANRPHLVLADEPTGSLDSQNSQEVINLLRDLNKTTSTTFLVVTHQPEIAAQADRIIHLVDGRIDK